MPQVGEGFRRVGWWEERALDPLSVRQQLSPEPTAPEAGSPAALGEDRGLLWCLGVAMTKPGRQGT